MCAVKGTFVAAFNNCARDNCAKGDLADAQGALKDACAVGAKKKRAVGGRMVRARGALAS